MRPTKIQLTVQRAPLIKVSVSERPTDAAPEVPRRLATINGKVGLVLVAQKLGSACNDLSLFRIAQNVAYLEVESDASQNGSG